MATKQQELIDGCFAHAEDDEPIFVLRANDELAPGLVRQWVSVYRETKEEQPEGISSKQLSKYREALVLADAMEEWRRRKEQI